MMSDDKTRYVRNAGIFGEPLKVKLAGARWTILAIGGVLMMYANLNSNIKRTDIEQQRLEIEKQRLEIEKQRLAVDSLRFFERQK